MSAFAAGPISSTTTQTQWHRSGGMTVTRDSRRTRPTPLNIIGIWFHLDSKRIDGSMCVNYPLNWADWKGWGGGIGFYVTSTKVLYLVHDPIAISTNHSD